jgi:hypothetical protein
MLLFSITTNTNITTIRDSGGSKWRLWGGICQGLFFRNNLKSYDFSISSNENIVKNMKYVYVDWNIKLSIYICAQDYLAF